LRGFLKNKFLSLRSVSLNLYIYVNMCSYIYLTISVLEHAVCTHTHTLTDGLSFFCSYTKLPFQPLYKQLLINIVLDFHLSS
jgi:hypothetical protein